VRNRLSAMIGCASVPMHDGGHAAASLWERLRHGHLVPPQRRVVPHLPLPVDRLDRGREVDAPPLVKGYLRCGARLLGAPAWDPDFNVADLPMMLDLDDVPTAYRARFLGA
jgi:putative hemolysin